MTDLLSLIVALFLSFLLVIKSSIRAAADEDDVVQIQYKMMFGDKYNTRIEDAEDDQPRKETIPHGLPMGQGRSQTNRA